MFKETSVEQFAVKTSEKTPTPGGGNVGAYVAALGAALGAMAARFTTGDKFTAVLNRILPLIEEYDRLRSRLIELMERDAEAYGRYAEACKLPKETREQKEGRKKAIAEAGAASLAVPQDVMAECLKGLKATKELAPIGNPRLLGDVAAAAYFMDAACQVALLNVYENAGGIADESERERLRGTALQSARECAALRAEIGRNVREAMRVPEGA